jgi:hypothetical protein
MDMGLQTQIYDWHYWHMAQELVGLGLVLAGMRMVSTLG